MEYGVRMLRFWRADVYPQKSISKNTNQRPNRPIAHAKGIPAKQRNIPNQVELRVGCYLPTCFMGEKLYQSKRKYCKISYQKRLRLIDLVENQKMGVTRASKKLRIKIPTAKVILSTFRRKGQVFRKKAEECHPQPHKRSSPQEELPKIEAESESPEAVLQEEKKAEWGGWMCYYPYFYLVPMPADAGIIQF